MTVAYAISTNAEEGKVIVVAGCDSLSGNRSTVSSHSAVKYVAHKGYMVFFSGHVHLIQRAIHEELIPAVLMDHEAENLAGNLLGYHRNLLGMAMDKKDKDAGLSGVKTLIVEGRTGHIITVGMDGAIVDADLFALDGGNVLSYAAIGSGAPMAMGVLYGMYRPDYRRPSTVLEDMVDIDMEAPLRCCETWDKSVGGDLRTFRCIDGEWE